MGTHEEQIKVFKGCGALAGAELYPLPNPPANGGAGGGEGAENLNPSDTHPTRAAFFTGRSCSWSAGASASLKVRTPLIMVEMIDWRDMMSSRTAA